MTLAAGVLIQGVQSSQYEQVSKVQLNFAGARVMEPSEMVLVAGKGKQHNISGDKLFHLCM